MYIEAFLKYFFFILFGTKDSYKIPITKGKECIMPKFSKGCIFIYAEILNTS